MPELPEVEVVRRGLARWLAGAQIGAVEVRHPRPVRWHGDGPADFVGRLAGATVQDAVRRGKYLWLPLDTGEALLVHLGMSGQLRLSRAGTDDERHLRVRLAVTPAGGALPAVAVDGTPVDAAVAAVPDPVTTELRFVDQRMFGGLAVVPLGPTPDGLPAGIGGDWMPSAPLLPPQVVHIARDPLDPHLDEDALIARLRRRRTGIKRALLDQTLVSGVGNIYADESLWRARLHYARPTGTLTRPSVGRLLTAVRDVMNAALAAGGTSFDSLYANVNGESGSFDRSLAVYGRAGEPCPECATPVRRDAFMNRSSFSCPRCQPRPRTGR
jgi:formamidopyrimidine-DNA glycosylase